MFELDGYIFKFRRFENAKGAKVDSWCHIYDSSEYHSKGKGANPLAWGVALLHPKKDKFNNFLGKQICLYRALDTMKFNREFKKKVFAKFEEEHAKGRL